MNNLQEIPQQPKPRGRPKKLINPTTNNDGRYIEYESLPLDLSSIQKEDGELISSLEQGNYRGMKIEKFNDIIITSDSKLPIITDEQTIQAILKICHDQTGHWNHIATKEIIQQVVYIPDLSTKCKAYVENCNTCNRFNSTKYITAPSTEQDYEIFECLAADAMGPQESTNEESIHIMIYVCPASKFVIAHPMKNLTSKSIIESLQKIKASYTLPKILRTDGARYWTSKEVSEYLKTNQVIHSISTPTNSTGNAYAERFIRTLQSAIGKLLLDYPQSEWDTILPEAVYALNHYPRQGSTPFQRILRHKPTTVLQLAMQKSLSKDKLNEAKHVMKTLEASAYIPVKRRTKFQPRFEDQAQVKGISKDGKTLHLQRNDRSYIRPRRNAKLRNH